MNMAVKQYMNHLIREIAQRSTILLVSVCKAWLRAMVAKLAGQIARGG